MSGFIPIKMYLALAGELKAYKDQNQFLEKEIKEMRAKNQELRVHSVNVDEQMELIYAQYKTHAHQNPFLKSESKKVTKKSLFYRKCQQYNLPSSIPQTQKISIVDKKTINKNKRGRPKLIKGLSVPAKKMRLFFQIDKTFYSNYKTFYLR